MQRIYLDHQATTPLLQAVREAMLPHLEAAFGSASSLHALGLQARDALAAARERFATFLNVTAPEQILFTSGATEAANLAVQGAVWSAPAGRRHIVFTATDHPAVVRSIEFLQRHAGASATRVAVDSEGIVDPAAIRAAIQPSTALVCTHHANLDIGTIQPVREIAAITGELGIPLFVDATASGGWLPVDVQALGADLLSLSPHRFHGPKGVGVLYLRRSGRLAPLLHGGLQEGGLRAGTENIPAIVGAGVAAEIAVTELPDRQARAAALQHQLWDGFRSRIEFLRLHGPEPGPHRLPTNLNLSVEFVEGEGLALMLDVQGICIAAGAACASRAMKVPPVLEAIGVDHALAQANTLFSLGRDTTPAEIATVVEVFPRVVARLRGMSPLWEDFQAGRIDSVVSPRGTAARG